VRPELVRCGHEICKSTAAKMMLQEGLSAATQRRFRVKTTDSKHDLAVAENTLNREFERDQPNGVWVSDCTYIPTKSGWLYLVAIIDVYSRKVVGWSMDVTISTDVFLSALEMVLGRRRNVNGLTQHSHSGSQYCSQAFRSALRRHGIACSVSRTGN